MRFWTEIILELIVGCLLGFLVLASVYFDIAFVIRLIAISVISVLYGIISALFGYFMPNYDWKSKLVFLAPGAIILFFYMLSQLSRFFNPFYMIYILSILCFTFFGALIGDIRRQS